jgi:hypothetical protein
MLTPHQITFPEVRHADAVEQCVRERATKLGTPAARIMSGLLEAHSDAARLAKAAVGETKKKNAK